MKLFGKILGVGSQSRVAIMTHSRAVLQISALLALLLLSGCVVERERLLESRGHQAVVEHDFVRDRQRCQARGGLMVVSASRTLKADGIPQPGDSYFCQLLPDLTQGVLSYGSR